MTPEEKARIKIDQWLTEAGWKVINREEYEPTCTAVALSLIHISYVYSIGLYGETWFSVRYDFLPSAILNQEDS